MNPKGENNSPSSLFPGIGIWQVGMTKHMAGNNEYGSHSDLHEFFYILI